MTKFSLSLSKNKALPETVEVDGSAFSFNASFRVMLRILKMLEDDDVAESHKPKLMCSWFYAGTAPRDLDAAIKAFMWFLHCGNVPKRTEHSTKPPVFDHECDAEEIYSSFLMLYGIDLLDSEMHWWKFSMLLNGAMRCACPLSEKIRLRSIDADKYENPQDVREAQAAISIETKTSRADRRERERLYEVLTGGGDVSAALEAYKNGV